MLWGHIEGCIVQPKATNLQIYSYAFLYEFYSFDSLTFNLVAHLKLIFVYGSCFCYFFLISLLGLQRYKNQI